MDPARRDAARVTTSEADYREPARGVVRETITRLARMYGLDHPSEDQAAELMVFAALDKSKDFVTRSEAFFALYHAGDERAIGPLASMLADPGDHEWLRGYVAAILGHIGGSRVVEPLALALKEDSMVIRWFTIKALASLKDPAAVEPLLSMLAEDRSKTTATPDQTDLRANIALALGEIGDGRAIEALSVLLEDENADVRLDAATALRQIPG